MPRRGVNGRARMLPAGREIAALHLPAPKTQEVLGMSTLVIVLLLLLLLFAVGGGILVSKLLWLLLIVALVVLVVGLITGRSTV